MKIKKVMILLLSLILIIKISSLSQQKIKERYIWYPDIEQTFLIYKLQNGVAVDTNNITGMIALMDTGKLSYSIAASYFLVERGHTEIAPNLKYLYYTNFSKNDDAFYYLQALYLLKDPDVPLMLSAYVDSMLVFHQTGRKFDNWGMSLAIEKLRMYNNYTKFSALKSFFNYGTGELPSHETLYFYGKQEVYRDSIYNLLVPFIAHPNEATRSSAISSFGGIYWNSTEAQEILRQAALNDSSEKNRLWAIFNLKKRHNDPVMLQVCEPIAKYTNDTINFEDAQINILRLNSPYALLALKNIMNTRTPNTYFYEYVKHDFKIFSPDRPDDSVSINIIMDSLSRNIIDVTLLSWLGNQTFVNELDSNLTSARNYLINNDSLNCARQIKLFQQKVNEEYRDSLDGDNKFVTIEGWKFLYYNAQYILDRLPTPPPQFNLNLSIIGNGTVTKNPDFALYDSATSVTLTAAPATGYHFVNWLGDVIGTTNPATLTMNANKIVTANFAINTYTLTVNAINGTVTKIPNQPTYNYGTPVKLKSVPNTGYHFVNWSGDATGTTDSVEVTMNANKTVTANFAINTYTISASAGPNGSISPLGAVTVNHGASRTFTMTPNTGYHTDSVFVNGNYIGAVGAYTFTNVTSNQTIHSKFKINTYTITIQPNPNGVVTRVPNQLQYNHGVAVQLTATPNSGYEFVGWGGDLNQYTDNPITLEMDGNKSISVLYEQGPIQLPAFTINVTIVGSGTVTKTPNQSTYEGGTSVILSARAATGFRFVGWSGDATGTSTKITISMNGNKNITATFAR